MLWRQPRVVVGGSTVTRPIEQMDRHNSDDLEQTVWVVRVADDVFIFQDSNDAHDCAKSHGLSDDDVLPEPVRIAWRP